jgi:hypothetical protein
MPIKFKKISVISLCVGAILFSNFIAFGTSPESSGSGSEAEAELIKCDGVILETVKVGKNDFYEQLDEVLQSAQPVSAFYDDIQALYLETVNGIAQLRTEQIDALDSGSQAKLNQILDRGSNTDCDLVIDSALEEIQIVYERSINRNTNQKSSLMLVEKLDHINNKFSDLIHLVNGVTGQIKKFDKSFVCHIGKCAR